MCPVCLDELDPLCKTKHGRMILLKPCKHVFHRRCAKQWFMSEMLRGKSAPSCPVCRANVEPRRNITLAVAGRIYRGFVGAIAKMTPRRKRSTSVPDSSPGSPVLRPYLHT